MVVVTPSPPALPDNLEVFHTTDPLLYNSPVLVFYGHTIGSTSGTSRIQVHIFTPAGFESYARLSISPNSPFYAAVSALPREEQGDEACRAIAYALSRYFHELPPKTKECWTSQSSTNKRPTSPFGIFGPTHVAVLASRLARVENAGEVIEQVQAAVAEQKISWVDADIVLPANAIDEVSQKDLELLSEDDICRRKYGRYGPIVAALGERSFLPTSKMKRAASKPSMVGRSKTFRPGQREIIRKEMCELVDTESHFVQKMSDLCEEISVRLKCAITDEEAFAYATECDAIDSLFPASLSEILHQHHELLKDLQTILDGSDESAMAEIELDGNDASPLRSKEPTFVDGIGLTMFARALVEHLPRTQAAYNDYIAAHATFPTLMKSVFKTLHPGLAQAAQQVGEQRLTSLFIEPVQRLPRYTLYIDTISKQLPISHPALTPLLRARDTVSDICISDDDQVKSADVESRLGRLIENWPKFEDEPPRLITAIDVTELQAPFTSSEEAKGRAGALFVFTDRIVYATKKSAKALSARALQADAQKSSAVELRTSQSNTTKHLEYTETYELKECIVTESLGGKAITIYNPAITEALPPAVYLLEGSYANAAGRLTEEVVKARLEGRYNEAERQRIDWEVRCGMDNTNELNSLAAVVEHSQSARSSGQLRIEIDLKESTGAVSPKSGSCAKIRITPGGNTFCHVAIDSNYGSFNREKTALTDLQLMIARRVAPILQAQLSLKESPFTAQIISKNREILDALDLALATDVPETPPSPTKSAGKHTRPVSPVKQISNFLSSRSANAQPPKKIESVFTAVPNLPPKPSALPKPRSRENQRPGSGDALTSFEPTKAAAVAVAEPVKAEPIPTKRYEDALSTYLLALQARKGNVVGRVIRSRASADELQVNELYNALLEDPNLMVLAAQAPVDVLFAAFEKFLNIAWKDALGPVISIDLLVETRQEAETRFSADFIAFFSGRFQEMHIHNQRALRGIIRLLGELLDGTSNDGDRGLLTAGFVELLVPKDDPIPFIPVMDRFIDDSEALFNEVIQVREVGTPYAGSLGHSRSRSANPALYTANPSSLRKKFGFGPGINRENSKSEHESKVGSVWRSLSKKQGGEARTLVQRTKSTDADSHLQKARPVSQGQPLALGAFEFEKRPASQDSAMLPGTPLATIGESHGTPTTGPDRKKRRSSLSDLTILQSPRSTPMKKGSPTRVEAIDDQQRASTRITSQLTASPLRTPQRSRLPSSFRKENTPLSKVGTVNPMPGPHSISRQPEEVTIIAHNTGKPASVVMRATTAQQAPAESNTPSRVGLSERSSGNAMKIKATTPAKPVATSLPTPTKKLRVQSPQKIRERLQSEQRKLQSNSSALQDELSKISDEIAKNMSTPARMGSVRINSAAKTAGPNSLDMAKKINELSQLVSKTLSDLTEKNKELSDETIQALVLSENRTKKLDELYREANAENEALYKRFNDELGKVMKHIRGGEGVEELKRRLKDQEEEMEGLRRERARLKREVVGLRGRLGE